MSERRIIIMKKIKPSAILLIIGLILILGGGAMLLGIVRSRETNLVVTPSASQAAKPAPAPAVKSATYISGSPTRVQIPSLNIDLPIIPGYYNAKTQQWTLTTDKVQYATITSLPNNEGGNTFLYGHYRKNVFANLHAIKEGAETDVTTDNGHTFHYQLTGIKVVSPDDSDSVFDYQGAPILTIQTCTGLFFQNRQLFTFTLTGVN
jgi:LPXTG-site transpeptidase (sortase) family protein